LYAAAIYQPFDVVLISKSDFNLQMLLFRVRRGETMAEIVLYHHTLGLTPGVIEFAETLQNAGHIVHTPDLFEGEVFDDLDSGVAYVHQIGFGEILKRGEDAVKGLPNNLVYIGFSLGVVPAQKLAQTRAGALGAVFLYSCLPISEFGSAWPENVPVQIHAMESDPFFVNDGDLDAALELVEKAENAELFLYPGDQHIFADSSLPSYNADASSLLMERVLDFLS
jgi:dienelactone hydrolase